MSMVRKDRNGANAEQQGIASIEAGDLEAATVQVIACIIATITGREVTNIHIKSGLRFACSKIRVVRWCSSRLKISKWSAWASKRWTRAFAEGCGSESDGEKGAWGNCNRYGASKESDETASSGSGIKPDFSRGGEHFIDDNKWQVYVLAFANNYEKRLNYELFSA